MTEHKEKTKRMFAAWFVFKNGVKYLSSVIYETEQEVFRVINGTARLCRDDGGADGLAAWEGVKAHIVPVDIAYPPEEKE